MYYSSVSKKEINDTATKVEEYINNVNEEYLELYKNFEN